MMLLPISALQGARGKENERGTDTWTYIQELYVQAEEGQGSEIVHN